jgi:hypothetical protein
VVFVQADTWEGLASACHWLKQDPDLFLTTAWGLNVVPG